MSRVIFTNKTVDCMNCELIFTNCKLRMENCKLTDKLVSADEHSRVICENQSLKNQIERLKAEVESLKLTTGEYVRTIEILNRHRISFCEERNRLRDEVVKLRKKDDKLSEESSDLTTVQSSETLGAVDSEENAKPCENREGSF